MARFVNIKPYLVNIDLVRWVSSSSGPNKEKWLTLHFDHSHKLELYCEEGVNAALKAFETAEAHGAENK